MAAVAALSPVAGKPWRLPARGLAVVHGTGEAGRLSHYFLPRLLMRGERVLFLDGANCANPRRIARFARERGLPFEQFSRRIQIARAFTLWQPWQGYDAKKYAELLREAFEPFEHFAGRGRTSEGVETSFSGRGRRKA